MIDDNRNDENKINESADFNVIRKLADSLADDITEMKTETPAESPKPSGPSEEADPALQNISEEAVTAVEEPIPVPESPDAAAVENPEVKAPSEPEASKDEGRDAPAGEAAKVGNGEEIDFHAVEKELKSNGARFMAGASMVVFAGIFAVGALAARPTYSESEKRALAELPGLSRNGVINGSYFTDLEKWYSDTFPFKEDLLGLESKMESFYGEGGESYYGNKSDVVEDTIPETAESLAPLVTLETDAQEETPEETVDMYQSLVETNADGTLKVDTEPKEEVEVTGEQAGNIYVSNNKAYEIFYYNQGGSVKYASVLNTVKAMLPEVNVYDILVPNSFGVELDPSLQEELGSGNMQDAFNYIFSMMDPGIHRLSVFDTLYAHRDEYIFFNTDHHWTALGAYYSYRAFCEEKGITPHELSEFQYVDYSGFYGTFYFATNRNEALKANPDHVEAWIPMGTNDMVATDENGQTYKANIINDVSEANAGRKYNCFIKGDNAFTVINNPKITDGSSCVVVKESYGNAFVPFLVDHYQNVYVVDYRYYRDNLTQFIIDNRVQDLIFVNNVQAITEKVSNEILSVFS